MVAVRIDRRRSRQRTAGVQRLRWFRYHSSRYQVAPAVLLSSVRSPTSSGATLTLRQGRRPMRPVRRRGRWPLRRPTAIPQRWSPARCLRPTRARDAKPWLTCQQDFARRQVVRLTVIHADGQRIAVARPPRRDSRPGGRSFARLQVTGQRVRRGVARRGHHQLLPASSSRLTRAASLVMSARRFASSACALPRPCSSNAWPCAGPTWWWPM